MTVLVTVPFHVAGGGGDVGAGGVGLGAGVGLGEGTDEGDGLVGEFPPQPTARAQSSRARERVTAPPVRLQLTQSTAVGRSGQPVAAK